MDMDMDMDTKNSTPDIGQQNTKPATAPSKRKLEPETAFMEAGASAKLRCVDGMMILEEARYASVEGTNMNESMTATPSDGEASDVAPSNEALHNSASASASAATEDDQEEMAARNRFSVGDDLDATDDEEVSMQLEGESEEEDEEEEEDDDLEDFCFTDDDREHNSQGDENVAELPREMDEKYAHEIEERDEKSEKYVVPARRGAIFVKEDANVLPPSQQQPAPTQPDSQLLWKTPGHKLGAWMQTAQSQQQTQPPGPYLQQAPEAQAHAQSVRAPLLYSLPLPADFWGIKQPRGGLQVPAPSRNSQRISLLDPLSSRDNLQEANSLADDTNDSAIDLQREEDPIRGYYASQEGWGAYAAARTWAKFHVPSPYGEQTSQATNDKEGVFTECYSAIVAEVPGPTFLKFMELPKELRERVYEHVLQSQQPIAPHLCDAGLPAPADEAENGKAIRFHDDNQKEHNAVCEMLSITRVSRQVRAESLPVFYGANTFDTVADTPTYFSRLQQLGRFHMIRNVNFVVQFWNNQTYSQKQLRMLLQNIKEQKNFERIARIRENNAPSETGSGNDKSVLSKVKNILTGAVSGENADDKGWPPLVPHKPDPSKFHTNSLKVLKSHPQHLMGGIEPNFLVLRMLSSAFRDGDYNRKLVIHVPCSTLFDQYNSLLYFPSVCEGLGISLNLVSGRGLDMRGGGFQLSWHQKYQKKDFTASTTVKDGDEHERLFKRVQELFPDIESVPRPARHTYYRVKCKTRNVEWFSIDTEGGGIRAENQ